MTHWIPSPSSFVSSSRRSEQRDGEVGLSFNQAPEIRRFLVSLRRLLVLIEIAAFDKGSLELSVIVMP